MTAVFSHRNCDETCSTIAGKTIGIGLHMFQLQVRPPQHPTVRTIKELQNQILKLLGTINLVIPEIHGFLVTLMVLDAEVGQVGTYGYDCTILTYMFLCVQQSSLCEVP